MRPVITFPFYYTPGGDCAARDLLSLLLFSAGRPTALDYLPLHLPRKERTTRAFSHRHPREFSHRQPPQAAATGAHEENLRSPMKIPAKLSLYPIGTRLHATSIIVGRSLTGSDPAGNLSQRRRAKYGNNNDNNNKDFITTL